MARGKRGTDSGTIGASADNDGTLRSNDAGNSDGAGGNAADSVDGSGDFLNPGSITGPGDGATGERVKRKYTKRTARPNTQTALLGLGAIEKLLHSIHLGLSIITGAPEMALDESESAAMAKAIADVARHYPALQASEKVTDWGNLIITAGFMYAPRFVAIRNNRKARRGNVSATAPQSAPTQPKPNGRGAPLAPGMTEIMVEGVGKVVVPATGMQ